MILQFVHNIADNTLGIFLKTELLAILAKVSKRNLGSLVTDGSLVAVFEVLSTRTAVAGSQRLLKGKHVIS